MSTMFGWRMAFAARASVRKRLAISGSVASPAGSTFTAARRPMSGWTAR